MKIIIVECIAYSRSSRFRVVMGVSKATKGVLKTSMSLHEEHDGTAHCGNDEEWENEEPSASRWTIRWRRKCIRLNFKDLSITNFREKTLKKIIYLFNFFKIFNKFYLFSFYSHTNVKDLTSGQCTAKVTWMHQNWRLIRLKNDDWILGFLFNCARSWSYNYLIFKTEKMLNLNYLNFN